MSKLSENETRKVGAKMVQYIIRRLLALIPVIIVVAIVIFSVTHLIPGDPARIMLGQSATPEQVEKLQKELGLNKPIYIQFFSWFSKVFQGDLGHSIYSGTPVLQLILDRLAPTLSMTILATCISLTVAIPSAIFAVWKRGTILDPIFMSGALLGVSLPNFWFAMLLVLLMGVTLQWLPVSGYAPLSEGVGTWLKHLILPAIVLSVQQAGIVARMLRDGMLEVVNQEYIRTARSKGLKERVVLMRHAFFNAMIPTTTVIGVSIALLLGGAVVTERVFAIPGLGSLIIESISHRDYAVLQGAVLFIAGVYVLINLTVDLIYAVLDPRIRYD
jgi:peptide/nickel transport system permease protein